MPLKNLINKPLAPGYAQIVQDEIPYSVQPTKGIHYNPEMAQANTNINSWWNSAYNNVTNIQLLTAQGSSIDANKQLDTNKDELYKLQDAFSLTDNPNEKKVLSDRIVMLNNENVLLQYKIDKSNDEVAYYNYQKSQHPVDIAFQLKSDYLQSQEKSNFKDWFQNESAQDLSSSYAYGAEMVAAMFAPAVIKYALPKILAGVGLEVTGAAEDLSWFAAPIGIVQAGLGAEQLISAATILSEAAASGALLWDMRKKETYSEMQDNFQSRLKDITDAYKSQNGDKEIDDRTMTKLRLQAYQGLDVLEHKNNSLILGDALELLPLALPWGGLFEGLKNSSRLASILSKALTVGLTTYSEGIEEGLQWKYGYDYKKGLYDSKVYHHGIVPNSLKEYGTDVLDYVKDRVDVNGGFFLNYKPTIFDNADFRNNVRAGMLGGLTMSGASAFMSTALDGYKYMKAKNEIKAFQGQMDIEDSKFQSDILTKYIVSGKSKFLHWALESYKNIDGVDKEKISMLQDTIKQINKEYDKVTDSSRVKFGFLETPNVIKKYLTKNDHINILKDTIQLKILEQIQDKKIKDFVAEQRPSNDGLLSEFTEMDSIPKTAPNRITDEINEIKNRLKDRLSVKYYLARKEIWSQWATAQAEKEIAEKVTNDADALKSANDKIEHLKYYYSHLLAELPSNQAGVKYNSEATFVRNMKAMFQMKKDFHAEKAYDIIKMADRGATLNDILHHIVTNNHSLTPELISKIDSLIQQAHDRGDVFDKQAKLDEILAKAKPHEDARTIFENASPELLTEEHIKANDIADAELSRLTQEYDKIVNQPNVDPYLIDAYHQTKDSLLFNETNDDELLKIEFGRQNYLQGNQLVFNSFKINDDYTDSAAVDTAIAKTKALQDIIDKHADKDNVDFQDFKEEIKNQLETLNRIKEEVTKKLGDKLRKEEATLKENNKANWNSIGINVEDGTITDSELFNVINKALDGELADIVEKLKTEEGRKDSHWYFLLLKDRLIHNNDNTEVGKFANEQINIIGNILRQQPSLSDELVLDFLKDPIHFFNYIGRSLNLNLQSITDFKENRLIEDLRKANEGNSQAIQFIDTFEKLLTYKRLQENISEDNSFSVSEMVKGLVKVIKGNPEFFPSPTQFLAITQFYEALNVVDKSNDLFSNFTYLAGIAGTGKTNVVLKWVFKLMGMSDKNSYALSKYTAQSETLSKSIDFKSANDFEQFFKDLVDKKDFFEKEAGYIIFDEIGLLNDSELGRFAIAIQELNKRRSTPIQVLLLGDPQQLTENGQFGAAIDEKFIVHNKSVHNIVGIRRLNPLSIIYRSNVSSLNTIVDIFRNAKGTIRKLVLPYSRDTKFGVQGSHDINDIFRVIQGRDATKTKRIITTKENLQIVQATIDKLPDDMKANLSVSTVIDAQSRTYDEVYIALDPNSKNYNRQMYVATSRANQYIFIVDSNIKFEQVESSDDTLLKKTNDDNFDKYKTNTTKLVEEWNNKLGNKTEKPEEKEKEVKEQEEKKEEEVAEQPTNDLQSKKADIEKQIKDIIDAVYRKDKLALDDGFAEFQAISNQLREVGGLNYHAHGMGKSTIASALNDLLNLFNNNLDKTRNNGKLYTAPLGAKGSETGAGTASGAYADSPFMLISSNAEISDINQVSAILVNDGLIGNSNLIELLQQRFPNLVIGSYSNAVNVVKTLNKSKDTLTQQKTDIEKQKELEQKIQDIKDEIKSLRESDGTVSAKNMARFKELNPILRQAERDATRGTNSNHISIKYLEPGDTKSDPQVITDKNKIEEAEDLIEQAIQKAKTVEQVMKILRINGYVFDINNQMLFVKYVEDRLNNAPTIGNNKASFSNWRKGKNDSTQNSETNLTQQKADIERRRQEELNQKTPKLTKQVIKLNNGSFISVNNDGTVILKQEDGVKTGEFNNINLALKVESEQEGREVKILETKTYDEIHPSINKINAKYDAEYIDKVKKGEFTKQQAKDALKEIGRLTPELEKQIDDIDVSKEETPAPQEPTEEKKEPPVNPDENPDEADDNFTDEEFKDEDEETPNYIDDDDTIVETENKDLEDVEIDMTPEDSTSKIKEAYSWVKILLEKTKNFFTHKIIYIEHNSINSQVLYDDIKTTFGGRRYIKYAPAKVNAYDKVHYIKYAYGEGQSKYGYAIVKKTNDDPNDKNYVIIGLISNEEINGSTPLTDLLRNSNSLTTFADKRWINDLKHSESGTVEISTFNSIVEGYVKAISRQAFSYGQKYYKPDSKKIAGIIEQLKNKAFPGLKIQHQSYQFRVFGGFKDAKKPSWTYEGHTIPENIRNFVRSGIPYLVVKIHAVGYKEPKFFCIPMRTRKLNSSDKFFSKMKEYIDNCRKIEKLSDRNTTFGTSSFYSLISEVTLAVENGTELTKEITSKYGIDISTKKKQEDLKTICKAISDAYRVRQQLARNTKASFTDSNGVVLTDSYFTGTSKTGNKFAKRLKVIKVLSNNTDITEDNPNNLQPTHVTVTDGKTEKTISLADHKYKTNYENGELQTLFNDVAKSNRKVVIDGDFHFLRRKATIKGSIGDVIVHTGKSILPKSPKGKVLNLAVMERLISTDSKGTSNIKLGLVENGLRLNIKVRVGKVKEGQSGQIDESDIDSLETNFSHYTGNNMHIDAYVPGQTSDGSKQLFTKAQESKVFSLIKEYVDKFKDKINIHDPGSNIDIRRQIGSGALLTYLNDKLGENSNEVLSYLSQHYGLTNIEAIRDLLRGIRNEFLTDEQIKALYLDNERVNLTRIKQGQKVTDVEETAKKDTKSDKDDKKLPPPPPDDNEDPDNNSDNVIFTNPVDDKKDEEEDPPKLSDVRAALTKSGRRLTIEQLREYARKVLPGITDEELQFLDKALGEILVKGKRAVGVFAEGMIRIIKNGDYSYKGWLKHELFHKIFREYLTPEERAKLYMDATHYYKRTFGTWLEIEEAIAEDFQQIDTSTVLGWLKDKIMRLFSLFNSHRRDIYKIFDMIEKGEFGKRERDTKTFYDAAPLLDVVKSFGGKNNIFRMAQELTLKVFSHENREVDKDHNLLIGKRVFRSEDEIIASLQNSFYKFKTQWDFNTNKPKDSYIAQVKDKDGKLVDVEKTVTDGDKQRLNELFDKFMSYNGKALYKKDDFIEIIDGLIYNKGVVKDIMSSIFPDSGFSVDEEQEKRNADLSNEILDRAGFNHMLNANKLIKYFLSTITKKDRVTLITYGNAWHNCLKAFQNFDFTVFDKSKDEALAEIKKVFIGSDTNIEIGKRLMDLIESADVAHHHNEETKVHTYSNPRIHFFNRTYFVLDLRKDTSVDLQDILNSTVKDGKIVGHDIYIFKNNSKLTFNDNEISFSERYNSDFIQQTLTHINNTLTDEQRKLLGGDNLNMKVLALSLIQSENNQILKSLISTFSSLSEYNFFFAEEKEDKSNEFVNPFEREFSMRFSYIPAGNVSGAITGSGMVRTSMLLVLANNTLRRNLLSILKPKTKEEAKEEFKKEDYSKSSFQRLLTVLNLPVNINLHSFSQAVINDIMLKFQHAITAIEKNEGEGKLTDEAVLDNQKTFINGFGEIVDDILGHDRNDSVRTGGKTKYKHQDSSFGRDVLTAILNKTSQIFPHFKNNIYSKYNIFLNSMIKNFDMIVDNDHIKAYKNRTITYLDENKTQFISREFLHGFINSMIEHKFILFFNPISNRPNTLGIKTDILKEADIKNSIRDAIKQHIEIIRQYNSGGTRQVKSISGNIANNEFSLFRGFKTQLDFNKDITGEEINKAVTSFYDEMIERSAKVQSQFTNLFTLDNNYDNYKKSMITQYFKEYYLNHTVQTYFLNQLVAGSELYYKEGRPEFDFIKRLAGVFAPGKKGFISRIFKGGRKTFRVAVMKDIEKEIVDELFKNSPIFKFITNTTDAQGFMSERRYNELVRMYGENFDIKSVTKPVCFDINGHGIPIYMKYSAIVLTKELTDAFPELKAIADRMDNAKVDELLFESAIKVGCPKILSNFSDSFIHEDSIVTVSNYNYRIQQNPYHEIDSKTSAPSQIIHFLNSNFGGRSVDNATFEKTQNVYQAIGKLQEIGFKKFIKTFGIDEHNKIDLVKWRNKVAAAISKLPGSGAMVQLLKSNMTIDAKALSNRLIISFMSNFEDSAIKIKIPGSKLVLQSQVGIQVYETEDGIKLYDKLTDEEKKTLQATELKYKVDSKGNVLYAECIVPSMLKDKVKVGDIIMNTLVGFRIPSSNLHSAIPIRVVGFYPSDTNVIITPKEVTTIHGSDFDVDSLFILRRTQFEHDITIGDKSYDKSHVIGMDDDNNFDFSDKLIKSIEQEITDIKDKILINTVKINADKEAGTAKDEITIQANRELKSKLDKLYGIQESYYHNAIFQGILDIISGVESREDMFTPISFSVFRTENKKGNHVIDVLGEDLKEDERKAFIDKLSLPEDTRNFTDKEQKLYDLLVNKTYTDKNGVVRPIPALTKLQILQGVNLERRNINTIEDKQLMHEDNATGAKLTGIFAKCMSVFNYLNFASKEAGDKLSGLSTPFEILGKTYQQFQLREIEGSGGKVLETQDALVNAAIDNVKEGILALINANKLTGNVLPLLVNLGMPIDEIIMFLKQPILSKTQLKFNFNNKSKVLYKLISLIKSKQEGLDLINKINIYYGRGENIELSNFAKRVFKYEGREYQSVEHAYQTLKSGNFDENTYNRPNDFIGTKRNAPRNVNKAKSLSLMLDLITESFKQNPKSLEKLLKTGNSALTHLGGNDKFWEENFPILLMDVRNMFSNKTTEKISSIPFQLSDLFNGLVNNKNLEDMSIDELLVQYSVLEKFSEIYGMGTDLFENGQVISTIQNSPVIAEDINQKLDVINKVREKIQLAASSFKSNIFKVFHINNAVKQFEKTSDFINNTLWSYSPRVSERINKYTDLFGTSVWDKYEDREDMRGSLIQFLMSNKFYNEYKDLTYTYDYKGEQVVLRGSEAYNHIIGDKINKMKTLYMGEHHGVTDSQELADIRRFLNCFTVDYKRSTRNRKIKIGYRDIEVRLFNILFRDTKNISPIERSSILAGGDALIKAKDGKDFLESMFKYLLISSDMTQGRFKYTEFIPTSITNEMDYTAFMDNLYKKVEDDKQLDTTFNWFMEQYVLRNSEYLPTYKTLFKSKKNEDKFEQPVWSKNNYQFTVSTKQEYNFPNYVVDETNPYQIAVYKRINNELKTATYVWMGIPNFSGVYQANDKMFTGEETEYNHQYQTWVKSNVDSFSNSITTEIKEDDPKLNFKVGDIAIFRNIDDIIGTHIEKMVLTKIENLPSKIEGRTYAKLTYEKGAYLKDGKFYKVMDITDDTFNKLSYTPKEKEEVLKTICK